MLQPLIKIAVFGSTRGTDLQALLDAQMAGTLGDAKVCLVISNRPNAPILQRAEQAGVEAICVDSNNTSQTDFEEQIIHILQRREINLIVLIGFMKILSTDFVKHYDHKILNIHPSLLPKYAGGMNMNVHEEVLKNNDKVTGCTLHYVTAVVDEGPILMQKEVPVLPNDTVDTLKQRVQIAEQEVLVEAIRHLARALDTK